MSSKALAVTTKVTDTALTREQYAKAIIATGYYKHIRNLADAYTIFQLSEDMGLSWSAGLTSIVLIQGRPTWTASFVSGRVKSFGSPPKYRFKVLSKNDEQCEIEFLERVEQCNPTTGKSYWEWSSVGKELFTMKMADRAGLTKSDAWKKWPSSMLYARCITSGARTYCADAFLNQAVYTPDELDPTAKVKILDNGDVVPDEFPTKPPPVTAVDTSEPVIEDAEVTESRPKITAKRVTELTKELKATNSDTGSFLKYYQVESLGDLTEEQAVDAMRRLRLKREATTA